MDVEVPAERRDRAAAHRALGDPTRLAIADALVVSDRTPGELRRLTGLEWSLLAFHLGVLEEAGVVARRGSEGDRRRRYVRLCPGVLDRLHLARRVSAVRAPLFVCTHNSARSPFAAALWRERTGGQAWSAGSRPAEAVHPLAVEVAARWGVDLRGARPRGYEQLAARPDAVVSVCDRALEAGVPFPGAPRVHWSVPDPAQGDRATFERALGDVAERISRLVGAAA